MTSVHSRRDALPENIEWHDSGCSVAPRCLACPLPVCRFDVVGGARVLRNQFTRDPVIREAYAAGEPADSLAARFGVSRRTVSRVLRGGSSIAALDAAEGRWPGSPTT